MQLKRIMRIFILKLTKSTVKFIFLVPIFFLSSAVLMSCDSKTKTTPIQIPQSELSRSIHSTEQKKAAALLVHYFGGDMVIEKTEHGPAGSLVIIARSQNDGELKNLFMLPDQQHIIEGTLYSPHMTRSQITKSHSNIAASRASMTSKVSLSRDEMREKISSAIRAGGSSEDIKAATQNAVSTRVEKTSAAKRDHNKLLAATIGDDTLPQTAALPRNNTVVDKEAIFNRIENADWISDGTSNNIIYVFYDLTCSACLEVHGYLDEYINSGELQVRYLPVGALGPDALIRASLTLMPTKNDSRLKFLKLLSSRGPVNELVKGIPPAPEDAQKRGHSAALSNLNILVSTQRVATPTFAYKIKGVAQISVLTSREQLRQVIQNLDE